MTDIHQDNLRRIRLGLGHRIIRGQTPTTVNGTWSLISLGLDANLEPSLHHQACVALAKSIMRGKFRIQGSSKEFRMQIVKIARKAQLKARALRQL